ncbi:MAG: FG-GAP-like repeat-containing protein [Candidatus Krumholzibacteriia bacterium]
MKDSTSKRSGFTLVEMLVTIAIFGVIIGAIYQLLISSTDTVSRGKIAANVQQNVRVGMDEMLKDIRQTGYGISTPPAFSVAGDTEIRFWADIDNQAPTDLLRYFMGPAAELADTRNPNDAFLYRQDLASGGGPIPIAQGVTQLQFQYYDADGVALLNGAAVASDVGVADLNGNGEPDIEDIRSVEVTLIFESERPDPKVSFNNGYLQYSLSTKVFPVNLDLIAMQGEPDSLIGMVILPDPAPTILVGDDFQFTAIGTFANAGTRDLTALCTWISSDTSVASVGSFIGGIAYNDEGLATAKAGGNTTISCSYKGFPSSNSVLLKVGGPETLLVKINGSPFFAMLAGSATSVTLTAQVTDIPYAGSNIIAAAWDIPIVGMSGPMAAVDGAFDSPIENVVAVIDITGFSVAGSPYVFNVRGRSADNPLSWGARDNAILAVLPGDNLGPVVTGLTAAPAATIPEGTPVVTISGDLDDNPRGGSNILEGEYFVGVLGSPGFGAAVTASDGLFNSPLEAFNFDLDTSTWLKVASPYRVFVIGRDDVGNWGNADFIDIIVTPTDTDPPLVTALTGPGSISTGTTLVPLDGTASDATTGGSNIVAVEAFADVDPGTGAGTPMSPTDGAFDSPDETFSGSVNSFSWAAGSNHVVYARAQDADGNWGPTRTINVSVTSTVNGKDAVIALSTGDFEVWRGDGVGGFSGKDTYSTLLNISDMFLVDVNLDTRTDVIVGSREGDIQVWLNDGFGGLGVMPAQTITVPEVVGGVVSGDFNGDTAPDLVVATQGVGLVLYYQNDGAGNLLTSNYLTYEDTHLDTIEMAAAADFNNDSFLDVLIAGKRTSSSVQEFQPLLHPGAAGGDWNTQSHRHYDMDLAGVGVADYNMDGICDVVVAVNDATSNGLQVWAADGTGSFSLQPIQLWNDLILSFHTMDYDRDGDWDVLLGTQGASGQEIYVSPNNGSGLFDTVSPVQVAVGLPMTAVSFGFFDTDADPDVVSAGSASGSLYTFLQQPTNDLLQSVNSPFLSGASAVLVRVGEIGN